MTMSFPFTVYSSPLSMRYLFTVIHDASQLMVNGKCTVNGNRLIVNGQEGASNV